MISFLIALAQAPVVPIDDMGWKFLDSATGIAVYTRQATPAVVAGKARLWLRYEYSTSQSLGQKSVMMLDEYDCAQGQLRTLQSTYYTDSNLDGPVVNGSVPVAPQWTYAAPGTLGESGFIAACSTK